MNTQKKTVLILGAGPIGLFSAYQILKNNYSNQVVIIEKRFSSKLNSEWTTRNMVVQFHRNLLTLSSIPLISTNCPCHITKEKNEHHRQKYTDLDHMSINNFQHMILDILKADYLDRFQIIGLDQIKLDNDIITIHTLHAIEENLSIEKIIDATGYHSILMNGLLDIPFSEEYEYGCALKITWSEHEIKTHFTKEIEFHDCHENTHYYKKGFSSVAEFSYPSDEFNHFFEVCGFYTNKNAKKVPFLKFDKTPFSIKLPPFLNKIISLEKESPLYQHAISMFSKMREGKLKGLNGAQFIQALQKFDWAEADTISTVIRQIVEPQATQENVYHDLNSILEDLEKINVVFVPSRIERWLEKNIVETKVKIIAPNTKTSTFSLTASAVGDSLASTDFRHGLGVNRGLHTATELFKYQKCPNQVREILIKNSYSALPIATDLHLFNRAVACRDWLIQI